MFPLALTVQHFTLYLFLCVYFLTHFYQINVLLFLVLTLNSAFS